jgi:hypothetical protein
MMRISIRRTVFLPLALVMAAAPLLAAQTGASAEATLAGRMRAFLREVPDAPNTELAAFFPRRGDWTWEQTLLDGRGIATRVVVRRFPGAETLRVIGAGGPACLSFDGIRGDFGPFEGQFGMQARMNPGPWRRVRGNRFVPHGASARSPVFVEWRREDGQWVVAAFGEEGVYAPRLLGRPAGPFVRDTTLFPEDAAFDRANWPMVVIDGRRYTKYGLPRPIERDLLSRIGVLHRVSVYAERGSRLDWPEHVYLATAPGEYQPYETAAPTPCD